MAAQSNRAHTPFLVCGLGSLGQYCVTVLKEFEVPVHAIEAVTPPHWEIPDLLDLVDELVLGDCRQPKVLEQAGVQTCRSVLLVTSDERINIAAAFAVRSLNPTARLVVRSAQENLNELLGQHLGDFVAFEATQLPAPVFAFAALDSETQGFFTLEDCLLRIVTLTLPSQHPWCDRRRLGDLNTPTRRLLHHARGAAPLPTRLADWQPDQLVQAGDRVTYIELTEPMRTDRRPTARSRRWQWGSRAASGQWLKQQVWSARSQTQRVAIGSGLVMVGLCLTGTGLFKLNYPELTLQDALNAALILTLGGYNDLYGGALQLGFPVPWWLQLFSVSVTVAGTVFIGILYAILTEQVLSARFQFLSRRPPIPQAGHIVLIGLGRVGQRVATVLQDLKQPIVAIKTTPPEANLLPTLPLVVGPMQDSLTRVNLATAKSVVVVTDDEVNNLEIGLMARAINPRCNLVLRTADPEFAKNVEQILPDARVLGAYALAAAAFAGAAFGENILNLLRLNGQTTLVTEYKIEAIDTLHGRLLAEIAHGYGVVPLLHQRPTRAAVLMPGEEVRLQAGDRLVVLATITGLQQIEQGELRPPTCQVSIERVLTAQGEFEAANTISRLSGCDIGLARSLMAQLPQTLPLWLYQPQAWRLVRELSKCQVIAHLMPARRAESEE